MDSGELCGPFTGMAYLLEFILHGLGVTAPLVFRWNRVSKEGIAVEVTLQHPRGSEHFVGVQSKREDALQTVAFRCVRFLRGRYSEQVHQVLLYFVSGSHVGEGSRADQRPSSDEAFSSSTVQVTKRFLVEKFTSLEEIFQVSSYIWEIYQRKCHGPALENLANLRDTHVKVLQECDDLRLEQQALQEEGAALRHELAELVEEAAASWRQTVMLTKKRDDMLEKNMDLRAEINNLRKQLQDQSVQLQKQGQLLQRNQQMIETVLNQKQELKEDEINYPDYNPLVKEDPSFEKGL